MAQFLSFLMLACAGIATYFLLQGCYIISERFKLFCELNYPDDLQAKKQDKLYDKAYDAYLTQIENTPSLIAHKMAKAHVNKLIKRGKVNELYSKMRAC